MLLCLDLETTGLDPKSDEIIEIALVLFDEISGKVEKSYSSLIRPLKEVPQEVLLLTHITQEDLLQAPSLESIRREIQDFLGDVALLGHNVSFDISFLLAKNFSFSGKSYDTFLIANTFLFSLPSLSLGSLCEHYQISLKNAHRALADVEATIDLFFALKNEMLGFSPQKQSLFSFLSGLSKDSFLPFVLPEANLMTNSQVKEFIISLLPVFNPSFYEQQKIETLSYQEVLELFPEYNYRENQKKLYEICQNTLIKQHKTLIEAPTGVGKTFGYLIPSIFFALKNNKQVIISTKTKILQDQICEKDIPLIKSALKKDFIFTKIKGKSNYISIHNYFQYLDQNNRTPSELSFLLKVGLWLGKTQSGELEELTFYGEEYRYIDTLSIQSDDTLSTKNPYLQYEFYQRLLDTAPKAQLIVTNHSFVLSDLEKASSSLLVYDNCIFDEAHSLEDIATESLKINFSSAFLRSYIGRFSFLPHNPLIEDILNYAEQLESYLFFCFDLDSSKGLTQIKSFLIPDTFTSEKVDLLLRQLTEKIRSLSTLIRTHYKGIFDDGIYLEKLSSMFSTFSQEQRGQYIYFLTIHPKLGPTFTRTYKHIGNYLEERMWSKVQHLVLLSATLSLSGNFDFIVSSLNLHNFSTHSLDSDFDYKTQVRFYIPNDLGDVKNNSFKISQFLLSYIEKVRGKIIVLFTSFSTLKQSYQYVSKNIFEDSHILAQGMHGGKQKILETFKNFSKNHIIFGTDSFWEGVDIPGDALSHLIIYKLPFPVPTDPVFLSRSSFYKNPFEEYAIPKTVLKLKQGFGRLIRTKEDKGVFILLDNRVIETKWGSKFFASFPINMPPQILSSKEILESIQ